MQLHFIDVSIIVIYLASMVAIGFLLTKRASKDMASYFLADRSFPWYILGLSNATGMFDITGTMWLVTLFFVYGVKSAWIPWVWPIFNQVFLMMYLATWLRRSKVITGAEWIRTRFGTSLGAELSHISVIIFAMFIVISMLAYDFQGVGKFSKIFLPWDLSANTYAIILMGITTIYVIFGGMYSEVLTDVIQAVFMLIASVLIAVIAIQRVSPEAVAAVVPDGWHNLFFGWKVNLDWSGLIAKVNDKIATDGFSLFTIFFMITLLKGALVSMAGPAPNYDMQKILATRSPKEAALMSFFVSVVLNLPRYLMIAGIGILGLVFFSKNLNEMAAAGQPIDFEQVLPYVINNFLPVGVIGIILTGLLAAFMSTFDSTVNCGASYLVNDIYKRYIHRAASPKACVAAGYLTSILIVAVGIFFGFRAGSIHTVTQWVVTGLYGGYMAPNVLKWHWWRFNGFGYFAGMISGIATATTFAIIFNNQPTIWTLEKNLAVFPAILAVSTFFSIVVSLLTKPEDEAVLKDFYRNVRPWGFWKPIQQKVLAEDASFRPNTGFARDMLNVAVGIVWQITFLLVAIYIVLRRFEPLAVCLAVLAATSIFLKLNWYNKLDED